MPIYLRCLCVLSLLNACSFNNENIEVIYNEQPRRLAYAKQTMTYDDLTSIAGSSDKKIREALILKGVTGNKDGYTIKRINLLKSNPNNIASVDNNDGTFFFKMKGVGIITFDLTIKHRSLEDVVLKNCEIAVDKIRAETLIFNKLTKDYAKDGQFTAAEILAQVRGVKDGYTLKEIKNISDTGIATVDGKNIKMQKVGEFTTDLILEHPTKADATITGASFEAVAVIMVTFDKLTGTVTGLKEKYKNVRKLVIQETIDGVRVTKISKNAFMQNRSLKQVVLPNGITSIGVYAFSFCSNLISISLPNSLTSIEDRVFANCSSLTSIDIPNSVISIGDAAFHDCSNLISIDMSNNLTSIGSLAFADCSNLTGINLPNSVISIGNSAFSKCAKLRSVAMGNSVLTIGDYVFFNCENLISISLPNSLTKIGVSAFFNCSRLGSVAMGNALNSIGNYVFSNCKSLISINLPNSLTSIGDATFFGCSKLKSVAMGNGITAIGDYTFYGCSDLTSINIPNGVTSIGASAFQECKRLKNINIPNSLTSIGMQAFSKCAELQSVAMGNNVATIGASAFKECSNLTNTTIPKSVTSIGKEAFIFCAKLTVKIQQIDPNKCTIGIRAFDGIYRILLPNNSLDAYKAHTDWGKYSGIMGRIIDG